MRERARADRAVQYIERTRAYYSALGYERPYRWAHFDEVPFAALRKPLSECTLTLITTASELRDGAPSPAPAQVFSGSMSDPPARLYTDDRAWDKQATHTEDLDSFFPIHRLQELAAEGRIGALARRYHGVPTDYSQRRTREVDAPEIAQRCREDGVDVALLVPL